MKNLKFRIWDRQFKTFLYQLPEKHHIDWERFDIQQFTGLLDKQSKEIYEGDIVKERWNKIVEVKFDEIDLADYEDCYAGFGFTLQTHSIEDYKKSVEVIGNIFENPELLNK